MPAHRFVIKRRCNLIGTRDSHRMLFAKRWEWIQRQREQRAAVCQRHLYLVNTTIISGKCALLKRYYSSDGALDSSMASDPLQYRSVY